MTVNEHSGYNLYITWYRHGINGNNSTIRLATLVYR